MSRWDEPQPLGGFEGVAVVEDAMFGINPTYNETALLLLLDLRLEDPINPDQATTRYQRSVGGGWEVVNGGASIRRVDGTQKLPALSTQFGRLLAWAKESGLSKAAEAEGHEPEDAAVWTGARIRWEQKPEGKKDPETGQQFTKPFPVEYLGRAGKSAAKDATSAASTAKDNGDIPDPALKKRLTRFALASEDYKEFLESAGPIAKGTSFEEAVNDSSDGGFFAKANA